MSGLAAVLRGGLRRRRLFRVATGIFNGNMEGVLPSQALTLTLGSPMVCVLPQASSAAVLGREQYNATASACAAAACPTSLELLCKGIYGA